MNHIYLAVGFLLTVIGASVSALSGANGNFVGAYGCMVLYTTNTSNTYFNGMPLKLYMNTCMHLSRREASKTTTSAATMREVPRCASEGLVLGSSRDYSETAIQRKARFAQRTHYFCLHSASILAVKNYLKEASKMTTERERTHTVLLRQQHKGNQSL